MYVAINVNQSSKIMEKGKKFDAVKMSRKLKRNFGKKWSDENGNPDWEKLKKILRQ